MTKSIRLSLVALALASTGILSIESASAALFCRGGHILPAKCGNPLNSGLAVCFCSSLDSDRAVVDTSNSSGGGGGGTNNDNDTPDDDTEIDPREE